MNPFWHRNCRKLAKSDILPIFNSYRAYRAVEMCKYRSYSSTDVKTRKAWGIPHNSVNQGDEPQITMFYPLVWHRGKIHHYGSVVCSFYSTNFHFPLPTGRKQRSVEKALCFLSCLKFTDLLVPLWKHIPAYRKKVNDLLSFCNEISEPIDLCMRVNLAETALQC